MNKEELHALAQEAAKNIKTEHDLTELTKMLSKITIEAALNAELDDHLGYDKHMRLQTRQIVVMATPARLSKLKMANSKKSRR